MFLLIAWMILQYWTKSSPQKQVQDTYNEHSGAYLRLKSGLLQSCLHKVKRKLHAHVHVSWRTMATTFYQHSFVYCELVIIGMQPFVTVIEALTK